MRLVTPVALIVFDLILKILIFLNRVQYIGLKRNSIVMTSPQTRAAFLEDSRRSGLALFERDVQHTKYY